MCTALLQHLISLQEPVHARPAKKGRRNVSGSFAFLLPPNVLAPGESDSVIVLGRVTLATPDGCLPLSNPTKCSNIGEHAWSL
jgi:hypothetical protein